ncbi:hypothetical protein Y032_0030g2199 [Ancylostoma ceylanicum]|nr:hypothetical protein Y032_0030g2199 [Ancylostoma ceylanicum]
MFLDAQFFDSRIVRSSRAIQIEVMNGVTDNQILLFEAHEIAMVAPNITSKAINQMILEWYESKRKIDLYWLRGLQNVTMKEILRGVEVVPWEKFATL